MWKGGVTPEDMVIGGAAGHQKNPLGKADNPPYRTPIKTKSRPRVFPGAAFNPVALMANWQSV
jgi:hypothetical protein